MDSQVAFSAMDSLAQLSNSLVNSPVTGAALLSRCNSHALGSLDVFGADTLSVDATLLQNYTATITEENSIIPTGTWSGLNLCSVTVTYTHPGRHDTVHVSVWLPADNWNGRFLGQGGGGWKAGIEFDRLAYIASQGFSVATTDGGHDVYEDSAASWAMNSPGNPNLNLFSDFISVALNDLAVIGKQVTSKFYGKDADHSYWAGCSTGGRQGLMLAQRYPDAFDGILALAPAINWNRLLIAGYWPQHIMNRLGHYPPPCELNAITAAAIEACDSLDGLQDGIISQPGTCDFNALSIVGTDFDCEGQLQTLSLEAATIANAAWQGPRSPSGRYDWFGLTKDTPLTNGLVNTECSGNNASSCTGSPFAIPVEWIKFFVMKDPDFNLANMTDEQYFRTFHKSVQEWSHEATDDPDLSAFKAHGGKMITWHGLSDVLIFPNGTSSYYEQVLEFDPGAADFYRYFEAPGVGHCAGGIGPSPGMDLAPLIKWVEEGKAPETLTAVSQDGSGAVERKLCAWPKQQVYVGGDPGNPNSFACR